MNITRDFIAIAEERDRLRREIEQLREENKQLRDELTACQLERDHLNKKCAALALLAYPQQEIERLRAALEAITQARLTWAMACPHDDCGACLDFDAALRGALPQTGEHTQQK